MERTRFGESFIVPTCISPGAGHITTVDQFGNFISGGEIVTENATIELRITIVVTIDRQNRTVCELLTDA